MKTLVILAGGQSRRMGQDKTFVNYNGSTFLMKLLTKADPLFDRVVISAGSKEHAAKIYEYLKSNQIVCSRLQPEILVDKYENIGPMGGLLSVFEQTSLSSFAVTAVDLPNADLSVLSYLMDRYLTDLSEKSAVMLAAASGKIESCAAVYGRRSYAQLKTAAENHQYSLLKALGEENIRIFTASELKEENPDFNQIDFEASFHNMNTAEDLKGEISKPAKKMGFGLMRLPLSDPSDWSKIDIIQASKMVDCFIENGFTYFDTAWMYHNFSSEDAVKEILVDRYPRDRFTLATKLPPYFLNCAEDRDRIFQKQLEKTGAGYFDFYLLHDMNSNTLEIFNKYDCFSWLKEKKAQGLVKKIGFSCHDNAAFVEKVLSEHPEMEFVQLQLNYLDWNSDVIESRKCYEVAEKYKKPVIVMEPVKGGTLAALPEEAEAMFRHYDPNASIASWAIRFAASQKNVMMVLSGMSNEQQMQDNISYMKDFRPLNNEEMQMVLKAADIINHKIAIPCTGCSYCLSKCPMEIAIPSYFDLYNTDKRELPEKIAQWSPQADYYDNTKKLHGAPADCIDCGQCEEICPQHLHIRDYLKEVKNYFEKE